MRNSAPDAGNKAYLKAGLLWLHACLEGAASAAPARAVFDAAAECQPAPALVQLAGRLELSRFETDVLLLAAALELDPCMPDLLATASGARAPSFALAMALFDEPSWDALSPHRPLRALGMLEVHQAGATALLNAPLRIDERICAFIKGINYLDERLAAACSQVSAGAALPGSQQAVAAALALWLQQGPAGNLMLLTGTDDASKRDVAAAAAAASGRQLLAMAVSDLPQSPEAAEAFVQLWSREAALWPIALLVQGCDADPGTGDERHGAQHGHWRLLQRTGAPVLLACQAVPPVVERAITLAVEPPRADERELLWLAALDGAAAPARAGVQQLSAEFALSASRVASLASAARAMAQPGDDPARIAWEVCIAHTAGQLNGLAQRIVPRATIANLQLPAHEKAQLERLIAHARHRASALAGYGFGAQGRGVGLAALFHGESGAGKTMAAEAVANALSLALFRVDLSAMISKYIGETSKNLRRTLDAAEGGGAVLLFDEADAVFSKRSEVKDSHDRFANIDIDYLLSRMESFRGVALLATNMKHALDVAFLRRLRFVIGFPFPGAAERHAIWRGVFPRPDRVGTLDFDHLSRFVLTGGSIFNAALAAAHSAAAEAADIEMRHVLEAVRWELHKVERPVAESAFVTARQPLPEATA